jgi:predicted dehydrogenase
MALEVNGTRGTLFFDYARLNELWFGAADDDPRLYGLRRIRAEHPRHPYAAQWWPLGQGVGWGSSFVNQVCDLLERWPEGPWEPSLAVGLRVQAVCEAMERSAAERRWVTLAEVERAAQHSE